MKKNILILIGFCGAIVSMAQTNMTQVSHLPYTSEISDVWGYVDTTGIEYALVGVNSGGTSVVSLADPSNPEEVYFAPGASTIWRDIKTWNKHSYTVNDNGSGGIQILDLSSLPDTSGITEHQYLEDWSIAHNIFIDERGYAYIFGANRGNGGVIILDLADPKNPVEIGTFDMYYVHDGIVVGNRLYLAHILAGIFSVVDISDPSNPVLLATQETPRNFTHNIWVSDDQNYLYTTDERSGAWLASYDISDLNNIKELDRVRSLHSGGTQTIVHNTHFLNDYIITSYYKDGVTIHDVSDPANMVETGHFDTSPLSGNGYAGCWGVYPYLPSGKILASDIEEGLFVLQPTYVRGAKLEGEVKDVNTNAPISGVQVRFDNDLKEEETDIVGNYATGQAESGTYQVTFSKAGYYSEIKQVTLSNGQVNNLNVLLTPDPRVVILGKVSNGVNDGLANVKVQIKSEVVDTIVETDSEGMFSLPPKEAGLYEIQVKAWGISHECYAYVHTAIDNPFVELIIKKEYADNFSTDFGWEVTGNANGGMWERGEPIGAESGEPMSDSDDCFATCYYTKTNDVNTGNWIMQSPVFDGLSLNNPSLFYQYYWHNSGLLALDYAEIIVDNGIEEVVVQTINNLNTTNNTWLSNELNLANQLELTNNMVVRVLVNDNQSIYPNTVEMAFDNLRIFADPTTGITNITDEKINLFPNPVVDVLHIRNVVDENYVIYNALGVQVKTGMVSNGQLDVSSLNCGVYILMIGNKKQTFTVGK